MSIHPTAIIDPGARLADGVTVGPYAVIGPNVQVAEGSEIMAHAVIARNTAIGTGCRVFPMAVVGYEPQDLKYHGEPYQIIIGNDVTIREFVSIHGGTVHGDGKTEIGDGSMLMNYAHVAHDCKIGNNVIIANNLAMAGHVIIEDGVTVSGMVAIHQFTRIGAHAYIGGMSRVSKDVPPYMLGEGAVEFKLHGPNIIGLRRKGFSNESILALKEAFKLIFRNHRPLAQVLEEALLSFPDVPEVRILVDFIKNSQRGVFR